MKPEIHFAELRDDWYRGADLMARLIDQSRRGGPTLVGFPTQWLPLFAYFGASWRDMTEPVGYIPAISEMMAGGVSAAIAGARLHGHLRVLAESFAALDPLVADVLHKLDRRAEGPAGVEGSVQFTGWQSYGRPEVLAFEQRALACATARHSVAVLLPCARRRPYGASRTHRRIERTLGDDFRACDRIVVSSLGVVPSQLWEDQVVVAYDSGVPDIYRVLRLMRAFFARASYDLVIDCLEFAPYRDCLAIVQREGLVGEIRPGPPRKVRKLPRP